MRKTPKSMPAGRHGGRGRVNTKSASAVDLKMTSDNAGITESGICMPSGTTVEYIAHVIGGMVRVRMPDGSIEVMHPHCFPGLR